MAQRGICSRREADGFISRGLVFVDGVKIDTLGTKVLPHQAVVLAESAREEQQALVTILLNKPIGYVSGQPEKGYKLAVELLTPENRAAEFAGPGFRKEHLRGLAPARRLDIDSKGLLVFTQDGRLAKQLTGEISQIVQLNRPQPFGIMPQMDTVPIAIPPKTPANSAAWASRLSVTGFL